MKKISPLGCFCILYAVKCWNNTRNSLPQESIKKLFLASDSESISLGLKELESIVTWVTSCDLSLEQNIIKFYLYRLEKSYTEDVGVTTKAISEAKSEVVTYFTEMFNAGYFQKIPMPKFCLPELSDTEVRKIMLSDEQRYG